MDDASSGLRSLPMCRVVQAGESFTGRQALTYAVGISADTVGARGIHMQIITIPPNGRARAHKHAGHESAIYVLSGKAGVWHGERLEQRSFVQPGDFFYIPADVPHLPYNTSDAEACVVVAARTDPNEQESVVLLPELEGLVPALA